jgi:hypothetical protein
MTKPFLCNRAGGTHMECSSHLFVASQCPPVGRGLLRVIFSRAGTAFSRASLVDRPPQMSSNGGSGNLWRWRFNGNVAGIRVLYFPDGTIKVGRAGENLVHRQSRLPIHYQTAAEARSRAGQGRTEGS